MGCGKTTLGRALGRLTELQFIDLDLYIEARFRRTVAQLFAERGEEGFRRVEQAMLQEVAEFTDVIVACGGGTPCFFDNMDLMLSHGTVVWLDTPAPRIIERLKINRSKRPTIAALSNQELEQFVNKAMADRHPYYCRAHHTFNGSALEDHEQIATTAAAFIDRFITTK